MINELRSTPSILATPCHHGWMPELSVEYRKWPDARHYIATMTLLGEDAAGLWAGTRAGARIERGSGATSTSSADSVTLFPTKSHWAARWYEAKADQGRAAKFSCYVDIATPATRTASGLHLVDLDLDVALTWEGEIVRLDEDEFEHHRSTLGYPAELAQAALAAFDEVHLALTQGAFPFDGTANPYTKGWFESLC